MSPRFLPVAGERAQDAAADRLLRSHEERLRELIRRVDALERAIETPVEVLAATMLAVGDRIGLSHSRARILAVEIVCPVGLILTSTPNIDPGQFDGQILILRRSASGGSLTLRNETSLAGSGLRLIGAADQALGSRDAIALMWRASTAEWWQWAPLAVV